MTTAHDPCAFCERFKVTLRADLPAGHGWCIDHEQEKPWDYHPCPLFKEAKDRAPRARYVAQQQANIEKQKETA